jgi:ubiquitin-protein ligase
MISPSNATLHTKVKFPESYPIGAPKVRFFTHVYHPSVDTADDGAICAEVVEKVGSIIT